MEYGDKIMNCIEHTNRVKIGIIIITSWFIFFVLNDKINSVLFETFLVLYICMTFFVVLRCFGEYINCIFYNDGCNKSPFIK